MFSGFERLNPLRGRGDMSADESQQELDKRKKRAKEEANRVSIEAGDKIEQELNRVTSMMVDGLNMEPERARGILGELTIDNLRDGLNPSGFVAALAAKKGAGFDEEEEAEFDELFIGLVAYCSPIGKMVFGVETVMSDEEADRSFGRLREMLGVDHGKTRLDGECRDSLGE